MVEATQVDPGEASVSPRRSGGHRPTDNDDDDDDNDDNDDNDDDNDDNGSFILSLCPSFTFRSTWPPRAAARPPPFWLLPAERCGLRRRRSCLSGEQAVTAAGF